MRKAIVLSVLGIAAVAAIVYRRLANPETF